MPLRYIQYGSTHNLSPFERTKCGIKPGAILESIHISPTIHVILASAEENPANTRPSIPPWDGTRSARNLRSRETLSSYLLLVPQLKPSYELRMEEPYDRAVALHLLRRAARDEGLKVTVCSRLIRGQVLIGRTVSIIVFKWDDAASARASQDKC